MRLVVIQQGRMRDRQVIALRDEFAKRFARYGKLEIIEREPRGDAPLWPDGVRWRVAMDERGEQLTSVALAERLERWTAAHGTVGFLVGDADRLHPPSRALANATLGLSQLTLPHQFAHLLLIEQLYRAASIRAGSPYHHA